MIGLIWILFVTPLEQAAAAEMAPSPGGSATGKASPRPPQSGTPSAWRRFRERWRHDGVGWRRVAFYGTAYSPEWWNRMGPAITAFVIFMVVGRNRRAMAANQARVLGLAPRSLAAHRAALRAFVSFAHCMRDMLEMFGPRPRALEVRDPEVNPVAWALERGRGVILVSAHVGNWDVSARALREHGRPVNLVMAREANASAVDFTREARERAGVQIIHSDSSVFSAFNMIRALRRNEILALQIDRVAKSSTAPSAECRVPFFGEEATFQEGPFHLARVSGAPIVPVFTLRRGWRSYEVVIGLPRTVERSDPADPRRALEETVSLLEALVRDQPDQWFEFSDFWRNGSAP